MSALLAITLLMTPAPDALAGPDAITPAAVLDYARAHAPALRAARHRLDAARHAAGAAAPWPEPRLMLGANPLPIETRNGPAWGSASLTQVFPWTDALAAQRDAAAAGADAAAEALRLAELQVEEAALRALYALRLARDEAAINRDVAAIAERLLRLTEERLAVDRASQSDMLDARIELSRLETRAIDLAQQAETRRAELNAAIGRDVLAPVGPIATHVGSETESLDALLDDARRAHPELARLDAQLTAARARLRAAETEGRPSLSAGLSYTLIGAADGPMAADPGRDALGVQVGLSLPIWGRAQYAASRDAAAAAVDAAAAERAAAEAVIAHRVVEQAVRAETALRRLRLYRDIALPLSTRSLEALEAAYAAGGAPFDRVLAAERARERYAIEAAQAAADFAMQRAALARAVGRSPGAAANGARAKGASGEGSER